MASRPREPKVFFPWEKRRGLRALIGRGRVRQVLVIAGAASTFLLLHLRERHSADVRTTRAEITIVDHAISAWRADHDRACPASLAELVSGGYLHQVPRDAWGHALRVSCPGRRDPRGFDVSSDGADGEPWGADRVE